MNFTSLTHSIVDTSAETYHMSDRRRSLQKNSTNWAIILLLSIKHVLNIFFFVFQSAELSIQFPSWQLIWNASKSISKTILSTKNHLKLFARYYFQILKNKRQNIYKKTNKIIGAYNYPICFWTEIQ